MHASSPFGFPPALRRQGARSVVAVIDRLLVVVPLPQELLNVRAEIGFHISVVQERTVPFRFHVRSSPLIAGLRSPPNHSSPIAGRSGALQLTSMAAAFHHKG